MENANETQEVANNVNDNLPKNNLPEDDKLEQDKTDPIIAGESQSNEDKLSSAKVCAEEANKDNCTDD